MILNPVLFMNVDVELIGQTGNKQSKSKLDLLAKCEAFGPVAPTPPHVEPVGYTWVFVWKRNEKNNIVRYKDRLVAQGFSQRLGIDYDETYSPVMDVITFRYLINLVVSEKLSMQLMDVVIAYLYGDLDKKIYMKVLEGLTLTRSTISKPETRSQFDRGVHSKV